MEKAEGKPFCGSAKSGNRRRREGRTYFRKKRRSSLGAKIDRNGKEWQKVGRGGVKNLEKLREPLPASSPCKIIF